MGDMMGDELENHCLDAYDNEEILGNDSKQLNDNEKVGLCIAMVQRTMTKMEKIIEILSDLPKADAKWIVDFLHREINK